MHASFENVADIRNEMMRLLRQQMSALDSPAGLTYEQLRECYVRQTRVQELREMLQSAIASQEDAAVIGARQSAPISEAAFSEAL
jgi:hypothetical protein